MKSLLIIAGLLAVSCAVVHKTTAKKAKREVKPTESKDAPLVTKELVLVYDKSSRGAIEDYIANGGTYQLLWSGFEWWYFGDTSDLEFTPDENGNMLHVIVPVVLPEGKTTISNRTLELYDTIIMAFGNTGDRSAVSISDYNWQLTTSGLSAKGFQKV